jgi:hypothetical protein
LVSRQFSTKQREHQSLQEIEAVYLTSQRSVENAPMLYLALLAASLAQSAGRRALHGKPVVEDVRGSLPCTNLCHSIDLAAMPCASDA